MQLTARELIERLQSIDPDAWVMSEYLLEYWDGESGDWVALWEDDEDDCE